MAGIEPIVAGYRDALDDSWQVGLCRCSPAKFPGEKLIEARKTLAHLSNTRKQCLELTHL